MSANVSAAKQKHANTNGNNQTTYDESEGTNTAAICISGHIELLDRRWG
jgi:hypothetical protein